MTIRKKFYIKTSFKWYDYCAHFLSDITLAVQEVKKTYRRRGGSVKGRVKWFNNEKGYGFIEYKENEDIFVHYSAIRQDGYKTLEEGQIVEFKLLETAKGLQALDVVVTKELSTTK